MSLFPLNSLDELTDDGLSELHFQVTRELEKRDQDELEQEIRDSEEEDNASHTVPSQQ